MNGVVAVVDAVNGIDALERFEEARRQVAVADLILVAKRDLARDDAARKVLGTLEDRLRREAPNATVAPVEDATAAMTFARAAFDPSGRPPDVLEWLRFDADGAAAHGHDHCHHHGHSHSHHHDPSHAHGPHGPITAITITPMTSTGTATRRPRSASPPRRPSIRGTLRRR
ncbi:MAG: GTP-binding protein [Pseudomonadota bacterium]